MRRVGLVLRHPRWRAYGDQNLDMIHRHLGHFERQHDARMAAAPIGDGASSPIGFHCTIAAPWQLGLAPPVLEVRAARRDARYEPFLARARRFLADRPRFDDGAFSRTGAMGGRGSDVAREAAALVLLDDDFAAIVAAIRLGRRIFDNIRKAIAFTFAVHVPIAGLCVLPVVDPAWPILLLPVHIVFLEMVINPACALIFEAEPAEGDIMARPPRARGERLFTWRSLAPSVLQGASALAICIGIFVYARIDHGDDAARALTFAALVAAVVAIIITNRSWSRGLATVLRTPNPAQWPVVLGAIAVLAVVLSLPVARTLFHFAPLHLLDLAISIGAGLLCVGWIEALKAGRRARAGRGPGAPPPHAAAGNPAHPVGGG